MLRDYTLLQDKYLINEKEYLRILREETGKVIGNYVIWSISWKSMLIHEELDKLFVNNPFFYRLISEYGYKDILKDKNMEYGYVGEYNQFDFDHSLSIQLKSEVPVYCTDTITGILAFPYLSWEQVKQWVDKAPSNYKVYIINPILIHYNIGAVGVLLTMDYYNGVYFDVFNHYCISLTGYPLFLTYTDEENVPQIKYLKFPNTKEDFVEELKYKYEDKSFHNVLDFWLNNDEVHIRLFEDAFEDWQNLQGYSLYTKNINYIKIKSTVPFEVVHNTTKKVLGTYTLFQLDEMFSVIDTDNGEQHLSDSELTDLMNGEYRFVMS